MWNYANFIYMHESHEDLGVEGGAQVSQSEEGEIK